MAFAPPPLPHHHHPSHNRVNYSCKALHIKFLRRSLVNSPSYMFAYFFLRLFQVHKTVCHKFGVCFVNLKCCPPQVYIPTSVWLYWKQVNENTCIASLHHSSLLKITSILKLHINNISKVKGQTPQQKMTYPQKYTCHHEKI